MAEPAVGRIPINGDVLKWARLRLNREVEQAARRVNVPPARLVDWEAGTRAPTVRQARDLADYYDRPFLEFFARELPNVAETELVPDYRFYRGDHSHDDVALKAVQAWAEEARLNALDLLDMTGEAAPLFPDNLFAAVSQPVEDVAERARARIGPSLEIQTALTSATRRTFPELLRRAMERVGIIVLRQSGLQKIHTRGLCLFASPLPVIVFGSEAPGAQAFTLAHELGHVLLRQSAISGAPRFGARHGTKRIEGWCNEFAAAFLMPRASIYADVGGVPAAPRDSISDDEIRRLSDRYAVSRHALLIRLVTLGIVRPQFYWFVKRPGFIAEEEDYESPFMRSKYYGSRYRSSRGDLYTGLVLEAWNRGLITNHNAAEFMGIKNLAHLNDIRANFGV